MAFIHRDNVVQQVSSAAFDPTLGHTVLPGTLGGSAVRAYPQGSNGRGDLRPVFRVTVEDQEPRRRLEWKRLRLGDPPLWHKASNQASSGLRGRFIMRLTGCGAMVALLIAALVSARAQAPLRQAPGFRSWRRRYEAAVARQRESRLVIPRKVRQSSWRNSRLAAPFRGTGIRRMSTS